MAKEVEIGDLRICRNEEDRKWHVSMPVYVHGVPKIPGEWYEECARAVAARELSVREDGFRALNVYEEGVCLISLREGFDAEANPGGSQGEITVAGVDRLLRGSGGKMGQNE